MNLMRFLITYLVWILPMMFLVTSIASADTLNKNMPRLATPCEVKDQVTYRQLIIGFLLGLIPFVNIFGSIILTILIIINFFIWLLKSPTLDRKPFAKKQWTSLQK
jgi:hypothetical protein